MTKTISLKPTAPAKFLAATHGKLTGPFADAVRWTDGRSTRQQPALSMVAWLTAFSSIMRGFRTPSGLRSNLYVVGVAPSGSGKDSARKAIVEAFVAAGAAEHVGGEVVKSDAGLLSAVQRQPSILFLLDEFGHMLKGFVDPNAKSFVADIATTMTKLFTSSGSVYLGAEYADQRARPRVTIAEPCVSVYGTATHEQFYSVLRASRIDDGTFSRFVVYDAGDEIPPALTALELDYDAPLPESVVDGIKRIRERVLCAGEMTGMASARPAGVVLKPDQFASRRLEKLGGLGDMMMPRAAPHARPLLARLEEVATKLALVHAVACDPDATMIGDDSAAFGELVAINSIGTLLSGAERFASESEIERKVQRVAEMIRAAGAEGLKRSTLTQRTRWLSNRDRVDVLATLVDAGTIVTAGAGALGRPAEMYVHRSCAG